MLGGADNPNGELPSYITGADIPITSPVFMEDGGYELFHISILVLSLLQ